MTSLGALLSVTVSIRCGGPAPYVSPRRPWVMSEAGAITALKEGLLLSISFNLRAIFNATLLAFNLSGSLLSFSFPKASAANFDLLLPLEDTEVFLLLFP